MKPILHPATDRQIGLLLSSPTHAIGISGQSGSGRSHLAKYLCTQLLHIDHSEFDKYPHIHTIDCKQKIGIDEIRQLQYELGIKVPSGKTINRIVLIEHANELGHEAQNALLKTIEEPPARTVIVMTYSPSDKLLNTIKSRLQEVEIRSLSKTLATNLFGGSYNQTEIDKAYAISGGKIGQLTQLLTNQEDQFLDLITSAKEILSISKYERLTRVDSIMKSEQAITELLSAIRLVLDASLRASKDKTIRQIRRLEMIDRAIDDIDRGSNKKLVLTDVFVRL